MCRKMFKEYSEIDELSDQFSDFLVTILEIFRAFS